MNLSEILSRLGIKGATKTAGSSLYENYLPILDANGKLDVTTLPSISLVGITVVADQAARLALTTLQVQPGDVAKQVDNGIAYMLASNPPATDGNWIPIGDTTVLGTDVIITPSGDISAINAQTALVELDTEKVSKDTAGTITAQHTFNPSASNPPFILGANAIDQKVIGLNAEKLDGLDSLDFIKKDGTVDFTADQSMGGFKLTNLAAPISGSDAVNKTFVESQFNTDIVREVPAGVVDGVNAVFTLSNTPAAGTEHIWRNGQLQNLGGGNDYTIVGNTVTFAVAPLVGSILLSSYLTAAAMNPSRATREVPTGVVNGINTVFSLSNTPIAGSEWVFQNGVLQNVGISNDYTIALNVITFNTAPIAVPILVTYLY